MFKTSMKIEGMMCGMCEAHICDAIRKAVPSAKKVAASRSKKEASFLTEAPVDANLLKSAANMTGYTCLSVDSVPYEKKGLFGRKTRMFAGDPAPFVMELPAYHLPAWSNVLRGTWERGWSFIQRAGTVIVISSIIIWFLTSFGSVNGKFGMVDDLYEDSTVVTDEYIGVVADRMGIPEDEVEPMDDSILARVAQPVSIIFRTLGFGDWKPTAATVTGLVAKEEVVANFGIMYAYDDQDGEEELEENGDQIWGRVAEDFNAISGGNGKLAAYAFMIFNLLCAPCFAAIGAIKREMNSRKWTWFAIAYQCCFAWVTAFIVWQLGRVFAGGMNAVGLVLALVMLALICWQLFKPYKEAQRLTVK